VTSVAVCVITFQRPVGLERLLNHLAAQSVDQNTVKLRVIVVENETNGPGRAICENLQPNFPFPLIYNVEPNRGIPFARNTAVALAGDAEFVAFIDDDEWPEPCWLAELLAWQARSKADIVSGPVVPQYESGIPAWVIRGEFHLRHRKPSGTKIVPMSTCNVLIRKSVLDALQPAFDVKFALVGGSDSHFFQRAMQAGYSAIWCDEALAYESVPASRATTGWICRRAYRSGANFARTQFDVQPWYRATRNVAWRITKHLGWGVVGLPLALRKGKAGFVDQLSHVSRAGGIIAGLFGHQYAEYQTIHGN
jgi:succinoglycan biosynthesis protein ExoM